MVPVGGGRGFPGGAVVKNLPGNAGVRSLEEGMATHSGILAWRIPMDRGTKSLVGYSPWGHKELDTAEPLNNKMASLHRT